MPVVTPDGRYIVVRGRLWRASNPHLSPEARAEHVQELMAARRAVGDAGKDRDPEALKLARGAVDAAKRALGERGPPWWDDGTADLNRKTVRNTVYADWWAGYAEP